MESVENSIWEKHLRSRAKLKIWMYTACVLVDTFSWVQTFSHVWNVLRQRQSLETRRPPLPSQVKKRRQSEWRRRGISLKQSWLMRLLLRRLRCRWRPQPGGSSVDVYITSHLTDELKRKSHHGSQPHHHKYTDEQASNKITWLHLRQTRYIWTFLATETTDVTLGLSWEMSIWWEWAQSLGSWILFSCLCVEKNKEKKRKLRGRWWRGGQRNVPGNICCDI